MADNFSQTPSDASLGNNPNQQANSDASFGNNSSQSPISNDSLSTAAPPSSFNPSPSPDASLDAIPFGRKASYTPPANLSGNSSDAAVVSSMNPPAAANQSEELTSPSSLASSEGIANPSSTPPATGEEIEESYFAQSQTSLQGSTPNTPAILPATPPPSASAPPSSATPAIDTSFIQGSTPATPVSSEDSTASNLGEINNPFPLKSEPTPTGDSSTTLPSAAQASTSPTGLAGSPLSEPVPEAKSAESSVDFAKEAVAESSAPPAAPGPLPEAASAGPQNLPQPVFKTPQSGQPATLSAATEAEAQKEEGFSPSPTSPVNTEGSEVSLAESANSSLTPPSLDSNNFATPTLPSQPTAEFPEEMPPVIPPPNSSVVPVVGGEETPSSPSQSVPAPPAETPLSEPPSEMQPQAPSSSSNLFASQSVDSSASSSVIINRKSPAVGDAILPASVVVPGQPPKVSTPSQAVPPKSSSKSVSLIILILLLLLLGGGGYYAYTAGYLDSLLASLPFLHRGEETVGEESITSSGAPGAIATFESETPKAENEKVAPSASSSSGAITATKPAPELSTPAGRDEKRKQDIDNIAEALDKYAKDHQGKVPKTSGTVNLGTNPEILASSLVPKYLLSLPKDPGSNYYSYESNGSTFTLTAVLEVANDPEGEKVGGKTIYKAEGPILENISSSPDRAN